MQKHDSIAEFFERASLRHYTNMDLTSHDNTHANTIVCVGVSVFTVCVCENVLCVSVLNDRFKRKTRLPNLSKPCRSPRDLTRIRIFRIILTLVSHGKRINFAADFSRNGIRVKGCTFRSSVRRWFESSFFFFETRFLRFALVVSARG